MIEKLTLQNFKVLRDVEVGLRPLTVIVGPNTSGKSSILQGLSVLLSREVVVDFQLYRSRISIPLETSPTTLRCQGRFLGKELLLEMKGVGILAQALVGVDGRYLQLQPMPTAVLLKLSVEKLAAHSYPKQVSLVLPSDGEGLSSVLAGLYLEDVVRFRELADQLRRVVPGVEDIYVRRVPLKEGLVGNELVFDMKGAKGIPAEAISDGTLLTLGLLTVLAVPNPPRVLLIDDLERGLHPRALGDLVQQLRRVQEQDPELQIVATSHSPYLLDFVEAEEVLLTSLDEDGYAAVRPLTDHPEYERWKGLMAPGEFWSMVGESWITKKETEPAKAE